MDQQTSIDTAKNYLENIVSFFGVNISVDATFNGEYIELTVPSSELNSLLIGRNAETLRSLQHVVSSMLRSQDAALVKVTIDIADYKKQRAEKLERQAREWIEAVRETGDTKIVELNAADRRIVHGVAAEYSDIHTESQGEGRNRKLLISQASS